MYGGVGLLTPRGSGTSGYVTTNKFNLHRAPPTRNSERSDEAALLNRGPNKEILDHNRKRELELEVAKQQEMLEAEGKHTELEIEDLLKLFRQQQLAKYLENQQPSGDKKMSTETHEVAQRKADQMEKLRSALGVSSTGQEGDAFNKELQAKVRQDRIDAREAKESQREEQKEQREKDAKKREKEEKKRAKQDAKDRQAAEAARNEAAIQAERQKQLAATQQREDAVRSLQGRDRFVGRIASGSGGDGFNDRNQRQQHDAPGRRGPSNGVDHVYSKYEQPPDRYQSEDQRGNISPPGHRGSNQRSAREDARPSSQRTDRQPPQPMRQQRGSEATAPADDRRQERRLTNRDPPTGRKDVKKSKKQASPSSSSGSSSGSSSSSDDSGSESSSSGSSSGSSSSGSSSDSGSDSDSKKRAPPRSSAKAPDPSRPDSRLPPPPSSQQHHKDTRANALPGPPPRDNSNINNGKNTNSMPPPPSRNRQQFPAHTEVDRRISSPPNKRHRPDSSPSPSRMPSPPPTSRAGSRGTAAGPITGSRGQHQQDPEPKVREWDMGKKEDHRQPDSKRDTEDEPPRKRVEREGAPEKHQARPANEPVRRNPDSEVQRGREVHRSPTRIKAEAAPIVVHDGRQEARQRVRSPVRSHSPARVRSPMRRGGRPEPSPPRRTRAQQVTSRSPPRSEQQQGRGGRPDRSPVQRNGTRMESPARGGERASARGDQNRNVNSGSEGRRGGNGGVGREAGRSNGSHAPSLPGPPPRHNSREDVRGRHAPDSRARSPPVSSRDGRAQGAPHNGVRNARPAAAAAAAASKKRSVARSPSSNSRRSGSSSSSGSGSGSGSQSSGSGRSGSSSGSGSDSDSGSDRRPSAE